MNAHRPSFLDGHVDTAAIRDEVVGAYTAITNGVLAAPSVRCTYIASVDCGESLVVDATDTFRVELDMFVAELADLELRFDELERARKRKDRALVELWIDRDVEAAWRALVVDADDRHSELAIDHGACVYVGRIAGNARAHMVHVVDVVAAIADSPARRMHELDAVLERFPGRRGPARLQIDGGGPVIVGWGCEIAIDVTRARGCDSDGERLRTRVHTASGAAAGLVAVAADDPPVRARLSRAGPWLASDPGVIERLRGPLEAIAPTAVVGTGDEIAVSFAGWVGDAARLAGAVELVGRLASEGSTAPYR